jgi:hypothetical protein
MNELDGIVRQGAPLHLVNIDAAYSIQDGKSFMGCIARDHTGKVL